MYRAFGDFFEESNNKETISSQGGSVYKATDETVFERFMILGSFGTFYANERTVTERAIKRMNEFIAKEPETAFKIASRVYGKRLAFRRDPAILALAALTMPSVPLHVRREASDFVGSTFVTGTDILHWASYRSQISGGKWNRLSRKAIKGYFERERDDLELQAVKYAQRDGWALRDLLRIAHPDAGYSAGRKDTLTTIFDWIAHPDKRGEMDLSDHRLFSGVMMLNSEGGKEYAASIVGNHRLPREAIPGELLSRTDVWSALLNDMPAQALFRNLGKLSSLGLVDSREDEIVDRVGKAASRLHPMQFLVTWKQYATGKGERGSLEWTPNKAVVQALEDGYLASFGNLKQYPGFKPLVALDVSGSMTWASTGLNMSCIEVEICLIEVFRHQFPDAKFVAFSGGHRRGGYRSFRTMVASENHDLLELDVRGKSRVEIAHAINDYGQAFMGTDLQIPLKMALRDESINAVITITDSETGYASPADVIRQIHAQGRETFKHAVVGLAMNEITIADPDDNRQMDFAGASADLPRVMEYFLTSDLIANAEPESDWVSGDATGNRATIGIEVERGVVVQAYVDETKSETPVKKVDGLSPDSV